MIGAGPAGLAAASALARYGRSTLVVDSLPPGGQAARLWRVENYPGFAAPVSGRTLMRRFEAQARRWGARLLQGDVVGLDRGGGGFEARTLRGTLRSRAVVLATGTRFAALGAAREWQLAGVLHGGLGAARRLTGDVVVAGGGEAAAYQALAASLRARSVTLVFRGERLKAHGLLRRRLAGQPNVRLRPGWRVARLLGQGRLEAVELRSARGGARRRLAADWLLVLAGKRPRLALASRARGRGLFVAGDARGGRYRQVAIAAGDGVRAAMDCERYLDGHR